MNMHLNGRTSVALIAVFSSKIAGKPSTSWSTAIISGFVQVSSAYGSIDDRLPVVSKFIASIHHLGKTTKMKSSGGEVRFYSRHQPVSGRRHCNIEFNANAAMLGYNLQVELRSVHCVADCIAAVTKAREQEKTAIVPPA